MQSNKIPFYINNILYARDSCMDLSALFFIGIGSSSSSSIIETLNMQVMWIGDINNLFLWWIRIIWVNENDEGSVYTLIWMDDVVHCENKVTWRGVPQGA